VDFTNEYYIRIYVRDTTTWKRLGWNGQNVLMQVLRKMDMAGVLDIEDMEPWEAAVLHCNAPEDAARDGMERCLRFGCLVHNRSQLVAPKYREANESRKSDAQRQREHRARKAVDVCDGSVTKRDSDVTRVNGGSHQETPVNDGSQLVTPSSSLPFQDPSAAAASSASAPTPPDLNSEPPEDDLDDIDQPEEEPAITTAPDVAIWQAWEKVLHNGNPAGSRPRVAVFEVLSVLEAREVPIARVPQLIREWLADRKSAARPTFEYFARDLAGRLDRPATGGRPRNQHDNPEATAQMLADLARERAERAARPGPVSVRSALEADAELAAQLAEGGGKLIPDDDGAETTAAE
jgi:hypothetical protein